MAGELKKLPEMGDAVRKNQIYTTAEKKAGEFFDSKKVKPIYEKELKSRNPNPKTPKLKTSEKKTKKQIFEEKFGEFNDMPYAKLKSGGRVSLRGGGICKKGMNKKAYGANS
jgi:hypothetical protein